MATNDINIGASHKQWHAVEVRSMPQWEQTLHLDQMTKLDSHFPQHCHTRSLQEWTEVAFACHFCGQANLQWQNFQGMHGPVIPWLCWRMCLPKKADGWMKPQCLTGLSKFGFHVQKWFKDPRFSYLTSAPPTSQRKFVVTLPMPMLKLKSHPEDMHLNHNQQMLGWTNFLRTVCAMSWKISHHWWHRCQTHLSNHLKLDGGGVECHPSTMIVNSWHHICFCEGISCGHPDPLADANNDDHLHSMKATITSTKTMMPTTRINLVIGNDNSQCPNTFAIICFCCYLLQGF